MLITTLTSMSHSLSNPARTCSNGQNAGGFAASVIQGIEAISKMEGPQFYPPKPTFAQTMAEMLASQGFAMIAVAPGLRVG